MTITDALVGIADADIIFDSTGEGLWRVLDARVPDESAAVVVGFVGKVAGVYEVTTLRRPLEVVFCTDLTAATVAVMDMRQRSC